MSADAAPNSSDAGGAGGSGIVVVRYLTPDPATIPPPRSLAKGTVVISGTVRNRQGAVVPAHHVRAGWWIQHTETGSTQPLYITGHSVDLAGKKNALTIGVDWMEKEIGVRQAELLAIPPTVVPDPVTEDAVDPYTPDAPYESESYSYDEPYTDPAPTDPRPTDPGYVPEAPDTKSHEPDIPEPVEPPLRPWWGRRQ
jgi:hypothetical protein